MVRCFVELSYDAVGKSRSRVSPSLSETRTNRSNAAVTASERLTYVVAFSEKYHFFPTIDIASRHQYETHQSRLARYHAADCQAARGTDAKRGRDTASMARRQGPPILSTAPVGSRSHSQRTRFQPDPHYRTVRRYRQESARSRSSITLPNDRLDGTVHGFQCGNHFMNSPLAIIAWEQVTRTDPIRKFAVLSVGIG